MLIVHRCTIAGCNHPDVWGQRAAHPVLGLTGALPVNCGQGCHPKCQWNDQPEAMPRWDRDGRPVTDIVPPGSEYPSMHARSTHDCEACRDLYAQLTGTTAPEGTAP